MIAMRFLLLCSGECGEFEEMGSCSFGEQFISRVHEMEMVPQ